MQNKPVFIASPRVEEKINNMHSPSRKNIDKKSNKAVVK